MSRPFFASPDRRGSTRDKKVPCGAIRGGRSDSGFEDAQISPRIKGTKYCVFPPAQTLYI